jgi:hypothetical protein
MPRKMIPDLKTNLINQRASEIAQLDKDTNRKVSWGGGGSSESHRQGIGSLRIEPLIGFFEEMSLNVWYL